DRRVRLIVEIAKRLSAYRPRCPLAGTSKLVLDLDEIGGRDGHFLPRLGIPEIKTCGKKQQVVVYIEEVEAETAIDAEHGLRPRGFEFSTLCHLIQTEARNESGVVAINFVEVLLFEALQLVGGDVLATALIPGRSPKGCEHLDAVGQGLD